MFWTDIIGAALTVLALIALGASGFLLALLILKRSAREDRLAFAIASIVCAGGLGLATVFALGLMKLLFFPLALIVQWALVFGLAVVVRNAVECEPAYTAFIALFQRLCARSAEFPFLALVCLSVGLLAIVQALATPPLAGDSITYHLITPTNWLFTHDLMPYFSPGLAGIYGFFAIHGDAWLWWWIAPSHSELYANLAHFPWWLLLGLATGGVARELGAKRTWPSAALLILLLPLLQLYLTTQYVDIMLAATLVAGVFFVLRWIRDPRLAPSLLGGIALALTIGTKTTGLLYAGTVGLAAIVVSRGNWRRRIFHIFTALAVIAPLGGIFYLRNLAYGVSPLHPFYTPWLENNCAAGTAPGPSYPAETIWANLGRFWQNGIVDNIIFGVGDNPYSIGSIAILLLVAVIALPFFVEKDRRRLAFVVLLQIVSQVLAFIFLPPILTRVAPMFARFIFGAIALSVACFSALAEGRLIANRAWIRVTVLAISLQMLTYLRHEIPAWVWAAIGVLSFILVFLVLCPPLAQWARRRWQWLLTVLLVTLALSVPSWAQYRYATRYGAIIAGKKSYAVRHIPPWAWLDRHHARGNIAVVGSHSFFHAYGVMGMRFQRRAIYVNFGRETNRNVAEFRDCNPRKVNPSRKSWVGNLKRHRVQWLWVVRTNSGEDFPIEAAWANAYPEQFTLRYKDRRHWLFDVRLRGESDAP